MTDSKKYEFAPEDIVATPSGRKGVVRSVGPVGGVVCAMVTWFDDGTSSFASVKDLKRTFRVME
jgi:uncharacterized protein (DUF2147 family)